MSETDGVRVIQDRMLRQRTVARWCARTFGADHQASVPLRALRLLEEVIEAYQAAGGDVATAHRLLDHVFSRPPGSLEQELGGVGVTVLAFAEAANLDAEIAEVREIRRVTGTPREHFAARNDAKCAAGFGATDAKRPEGA